MYLRAKKRIKDGKKHRYWSIVESCRNLDGRVVQRQVLYLGEINDSQKAAWWRTIEVLQTDSSAKQMALFPADRPAPELECEVVQVKLNELRLHHPRQWGACWLALTLWEQLELDRFWHDRLPASRQGTKWLEVLKTQVCYQLIDPGSEWRLHRHWYAHSAMRDLLGSPVRVLSDDTLYRCLDKLLAHKRAFFSFLRQRWEVLFQARFDVLLYDLTSTYFEGRCCPLAKRGYSRDGRRDKLQIVFGLLCNRQGCPVAVEVFDGNTADPSTVGVHIEKLRRRFALSRVVLVGDRGMLTEARIREEVAPAGLDWISALRAPAIRELMSSGAVQRSMFDDTDLAEIRCDAYPGERLIVCRNERLAEERARKREALLQATEALLAPIAAATQREKRRLSGKEKIAMRVGKVIGKYKMAKHFELDITETAFAYHRKADAIATEAALDGLYIVRTSVPATELDAEHTVRAYKGLSVVERAFRSLKTVDLKVRPIYHYAGARVRAHVFLCMLAYYVEWHMRQRLKPLLFDDEEPDVAEAARPSVVAPAEVSPSAQDKARRKRTASGERVHSFRTLLDDLATVANNRVVAPLADAKPFDLITRPTALQRKAFKLLGVRLERTQ